MNVAARETSARVFEKHRAQLRAVAYRMLGSVSDADDAVQEAWLRLNRVDGDSIDNMAAWLTTVVGRICVDTLRSRRSRREDYVGVRLPEPILVDADGSDPENEALVAEAVGLALLVVLDTLTPAERLSFVLHDMFGVSYEEIAPILDRSTDAARQLASRARRQVRGARACSDADPIRQREVVTAFIAAARQGDFDALVSVLDPDATFRIDPGTAGWIGPTEFHGADAVAQQAVTNGSRFARHCRPAIVNGDVGIVVRRGPGTLGIAGVTVVDDRIVAIDLVLGPR